MGINVHFYTVQGYYFGEDSLSNEELEEILDKDLGDPLLVSPMDSCDFIIGEILVGSTDGRHEPLDFTPFRFEDLQYHTKDSIYERVPDIIKDKATDQKYGTYCFICYH